MQSILRALRSPGAMRAVSGVAPSQFPESPPSAGKPPTNTTGNCPRAPGYAPKKKAGKLDRGLDLVVRASGSLVAFLLIQLLLVTWAFLGIAFHGFQLWPILISNAQAIFTYMFDSLLMRQQLNGYTESLTIAAELQSRSNTIRRMLCQVVAWLDSDVGEVSPLAHNTSAGEEELPHEDNFTRVISRCSMALGHVAFVAVYWTCIVVWIAFGPSNGFSVEWQLYINSATSALMVFIFSFLAILRERHSVYMRDCVDAIYRIDGELELKLRRRTEDSIGNEDCVVPAARVNVIQRAINYYADVVGTLVGVAILIIVIMVWVAIGPALQFNSNWWLFIGTYAGLVGLNDGFVLRNVQARLHDHEAPVYEAIAAEDAALHTICHLTRGIEQTPVPKQTISRWISERMNVICAHEITVLLGLLLIIGLLVGSSVMRWSEKGQLLCNIPPSIVESFFMIILITGHNSADAQRRIDLQTAFNRRLELLAFINAAELLISTRTAHSVQDRGNSVEKSSKPPVASDA